MFAVVEEQVTHDSSLFDSRSPQSSTPSSVPPRADEWDRTLRHTGLLYFGKILENAAKAVYPNSNTSRYSGAFVLLMCWQTQDPKLPVQIEIEELHRVLKNTYHYNIEEFAIPDAASHAAVSEKINSFVKVNNDSSDDLKIVYYAGHSRLSRTKELLWSTLPDRSHVKAPIVVCSGIQRSLDVAQSDVLILLDYCYSGVANTSEGNGVTELMCTCSYDGKANRVGHYSFTHAITTELRLLSSKPCFSSANYIPLSTPAFSHILNKDEPFIRSINLSTHNPKAAIFDTEVSDLADSGNAKRLKRSRDPRSPLNTRKTPRLDKGPSSSADGHDAYEPGAVQPTSSSEMTPNRASSENSGEWPNPAGPNAEPSVPDNTHGNILKGSMYTVDAPRALFAIRFREDIRAEDLSIDLFKEWLRSIPAAAEEVRVEGSFKCLSTLILISLPMSLSSYIPQGPAIMPLDLVRSSIILPPPAGVNEPTRLGGKRDSGVTENKVGPNYIPGDRPGTGLGEEFGSTPITRDYDPDLSTEDLKNEFQSTADPTDQFDTLLHVAGRFQGGMEEGSATEEPKSSSNSTSISHAWNDYLSTYFPYDGSMRRSSGQPSPPKENPKGKPPEHPDILGKGTDLLGRSGSESSGYASGG